MLRGALPDTHSLPTEMAVEPGEVIRPRRTRRTSQLQHHTPFELSLLTYVCADGSPAPIRLIALRVPVAILAVHQQSGTNVVDVPQRRTSVMPHLGVYPLPLRPRSKSSCLRHPFIRSILAGLQPQPPLAFPAPHRRSRRRHDSELPQEGSPLLVRRPTSFSQQCLSRLRHRSRVAFIANIALSLTPSNSKELLYEIRHTRSIFITPSEMMNCTKVADHSEKVIPLSG